MVNARLLFFFVVVFFSSLVTLIEHNSDERAQADARLNFFFALAVLGGRQNKVEIITDTARIREKSSRNDNDMCVDYIL